MYAVLLLGKQCRINNSESESESEKRRALRMKNDDGNVGTREAEERKVTIQ